MQNGQETWNVLQGGTDLEARSWVDYHLRGIMKPALKYIKLLSNILPMGPLQGISDTETAAEAATKYR